MTLHPLPVASHARRLRHIAVFGGSFDPIHAGHLAVARAAARRFRLDEIHFVPSGRPPHKHRYDLAPFLHRYAMVTLACADAPRFRVSLAEAGPDLSGRRVYYSIETIRRYREELDRSGAKLFFIVGADSFEQIDTWKDYEALLDSCDFIVAHRPGFRTDALRERLPARLLSRSRSHDPRVIPLRRTAIFLLDAVSSDVSATEIRRRLRLRKSIRGLVPPRVEEYILKQALYR